MHQKVEIYDDEFAAELVQTLELFNAFCYDLLNTNAKPREYRLAVHDVIKKYITLMHPVLMKSKRTLH